MNAQKIKKIISRLPDLPGVYIFKCDQKVIYIGKATSLRDRVRSYFANDILETRGPKIVKMLSQFNKVDYIRTESVLEALVLEARLIKKFQPEANVKEKDNRSFNFVVITKEDYPQIRLMRGREILKFKDGRKIGDLTVKSVFGPFPNGGQLKEGLKIIRKMFPYRDEKCTPCEDQINKLKARSQGKKSITYDISYVRTLGKFDNKKCKPCFNRQIGLCPGVCIGEITKEDYQRQIENIILFFEGNKKRLVKNLEKQMKSYAKNHEFEKASLTKRTLFTLKHVQDVSLIKEDYSLKDGGMKEFRIESYDVAHLAGTNVVGVMTVVEDNEARRSDYRKFKIKDEPGINDTKALAEILSRRLGHIEWPYPDLIVVDGGLIQKRAAERVLTKNNIRIPVVSVVKDEYHRPKQILGDKKWLSHEREILLSNSEAHRFGIAYHKKLRGRIN